MHSSASAFGCGHATVLAGDSTPASAKIDRVERYRHIPVWIKGGYDDQRNRIIICTAMFVDMWLRNEAICDDGQDEQHVRHFLEDAQQHLYDATREPIVLVYCHMFLTSLHRLAKEVLHDTWHRLMDTHRHNVRCVYVVQGNAWLRAAMCSFASPDVPIVDVQAIDEVVNACIPPQEEEAFLRHIPLAIRRLDTEHRGGAFPRVFGASLPNVCEWYGLDEIVDNQAMSRLPPIVFALTHELRFTSRVDDLDKMWSNSSAEAYTVVNGLDVGTMPPFPFSCSRSALWMALKLWFDCLPAPLFSFEAYHELHLRKVRRECSRDHLIFVHSLFHGTSLDPHGKTVALFLARFLHFFAHQATDPKAVSAKLATIFAPCYFRPQVLINRDAIAVANAVITTFVLEAPRFTPPRLA